MPVQQTYKVSDIEKRLKILNMQLYGKQEKVANSSHGEAGNKYQVVKLDTKKEVSNTADIVFLKQDLSKIALLAFFAIGAELILYFSKLTDRIKFF